MTETQNSNPEVELQPDNTSELPVSESADLLVGSQVARARPESELKDNIAKCHASDGLTDTKALSQEALYAHIITLAKQYNQNQPNGDTRRLMVEKHFRGCRCSACWYDFGGKDDIEYANVVPNSVEVDMHHSLKRRY